MEEWTRHFLGRGRGRAGDGGDITFGEVRATRVFFYISRRADMSTIFLQGTLRFFFLASFLFVMAGGEEDFNLINQLVFLRGTLFGGLFSEEERLLGS